MCMHRLTQKILKWLDTKWQRYDNLNSLYYTYTLQWRHNGRYSVSIHQPRDCLLNLLFRRRSNKTSKLRVTCLCEGNWPVTGEFPAQRARNAKSVSFDDIIMYNVNSQLKRVARTGIQHEGGIEIVARLSGYLTSDIVSRVHYIPFVKYIHNVCRPFCLGYMSNHLKWSISSCCSGVLHVGHLVQFETW